MDKEQLRRKWRLVNSTELFVLYIYSSHFLDQRLDNLGEVLQLRVNTLGFDESGNNAILD